jgi:uncharacterized RDD family membrane protein YckC
MIARLFSRHRETAEPHTMRRSFVTPEGVDLRLELGTAGARASAFMLDAVMILAILIAVTILIALLATTNVKHDVLTILWLIGFFLLRNAWFIWFEMGRRGATPGKRAFGLRVMARDGATLTGGAIIARNAMREIEVFLPLSFLSFQAAHDAADAFLAIFALLWSGIFLFLPLMNRDRLRVGDLVGGTWVLQTKTGTLGSDLGSEIRARPRRSFSDAALSLYGVYELQTLEEVLRAAKPDAVATVAATIRRKAALADDGDDLAFLTDYYQALCARLERDLLLGRRREDKNSRTGATSS